MEHDVLPAHCAVQVKVDLVHFMLWLHLDEEILIVENCIHQQIGTFLYVVNCSCGGFNKLIFSNTHFSFLQENPTMESSAKVEIWVELIRLIIINGESFPSQFLFLSFFSFSFFFLELTLDNSFLNEGFFLLL